MWPDFLHHVTLHFAIVLPMVMAVVGTYILARQTDSLDPLFRSGAWATLVATALAVLSGLFAGGLSGGDEYLEHHRYLGMLTFCVVLTATLAFEVGHRRQIEDFRRFGLAIWWVASFAVVGAGHFGGLAEHFDVVPF
jgi:hypothetical protein